MTLLFGFRLFTLIRSIRKSEKISRNGLTFVLSKKGTPTHSFLHWIFIDPELIKDQKAFESIVAHEKIHARQKHSFDLLLAELLNIIQWFNPFAYWMKLTIQENHEYLTDREVIAHTQNIKAYQWLLVQQSSGFKTNTLSHNFSYKLLERRIHMMKKTRNQFGFGLRFLVVVSSFVWVFFACSSPQDNNNQQDSTAIPNKVNTLQMPSFPGGHEALAEYFTTHIQYPAEAKENNIEGKVVVAFTVTKEGKITDAHVKQGPGFGCDEEALRVVESMPDWNPGTADGKAGDISMELPVNFRLDGNKAKNSDTDVHDVVEVMPEFPGGEKTMISYISKNISYPKDARKEGKQGSVYLSFIVEKDGSISNVEILRGVFPSIDKEATRVIENMPKWTPGMNKGQAVRVAYRLPIKFALQ